MNEGIIVIGAGGHAKVCIELLREMGQSVHRCVGDEKSPPACVGVPVLVGDDNLSRLRSEGYSRAFIAIGQNRVRYRLADLAVSLGYELVSAISAHSVISPSVRLGAGVAIMAGAVINAEAIIESLAIVNTGATVDHDCRIGVAAHIAPQSGLAGNVKVGRYTFLGVGSRVIPDISIGEDVTVGAGAVVIRDIANSKTVVGVPARPVNYQ